MDWSEVDIGIRRENNIIIKIVKGEKWALSHDCEIKVKIIENRKRAGRKGSQEHSYPLLVHNSIAFLFFSFCDYFTVSWIKLVQGENHDLWRCSRWLVKVIRQYISSPSQCFWPGGGGNEIVMITQSVKLSWSTPCVACRVLTHLCIKHTRENLSCSYAMQRMNRDVKTVHNSCDN